jgi:hypothetical protein
VKGMIASYGPLLLNSQIDVEVQFVIELQRLIDNQSWIAPEGPPQKVWTPWYLWRRLIFLFVSLYNRLKAPAAAISLRLNSERLSILA